MPCAFFRQLSILFVTTISFTSSKDLRLRVDKLDTHLLDGDGTESPNIFDSDMAHNWGEVSKANSPESPDVLLTDSGTCSTGSSQKPDKRRRSDAWCQVEQKKSPVQQQVNQGPGKSEGPRIEEDVNWAPKWDILKYGTPEDMYCAQDDTQRILVCAQDTDWRDLKLPDGTPVTFPTTIDWCSPYNYIYPCTAPNSLWCCESVETSYKETRLPCRYTLTERVEISAMTDMVAGFGFVSIYGVLVLPCGPNDTRLSLLARLVVIPVILSMYSV